MTHKERIQVIAKLRNKKGWPKSLTKAEMKLLGEAITGEVMLRIKRKEKGR